MADKCGTWFAKERKCFRCHICPRMDLWDWTRTWFSDCTKPVMYLSNQIHHSYVSFSCFYVKIKVWDLWVCWLFWKLCLLGKNVSMVSFMTWAGGGALLRNPGGSFRATQNNYLFTQILIRYLSHSPSLVPNKIMIY